MIQAFLRLILIAIFAAFMAILGVFTLREIGLRQSFVAPPHPWFDRANWDVYKASTKDLCGTDLERHAGGRIIAAQLEFRDLKWGVACSNAGLTGFLRARPETDWLFDVEVDDNAALVALVKELEPFDRLKHFGVTSPLQRAMRTLRKEAPQWLFGADPETLTRFHFASAFWIETALEFDFDFVIADDVQGSAHNLSNREVEELKRRNKRIIWNATVSKEKTPPYSVHGVMTEEPKLQ
jgi:hypothetical protein